jgi:hypothetical protein
MTTTAEAYLGDGGLYTVFFFWLANGWLLVRVFSSRRSRSIYPFLRSLVRLHSIDIVIYSLYMRLLE